MVDAVANGVISRVVLLARPGKAADNLTEAVGQAGAQLLAVVDPATTNEAALRAYNPHALLVALEPSIEASLDEFDELLIDPQITVIFDEADVAAQRSGWEAARWARHLSAKLRRDGNVLPPGTESDSGTDWQPSPGKVPQPSAAYANADLSSFTQEAVARADSVPFDGMPQDIAPVPTDPMVLSLDASLADAIPAARSVVPPPSQQPAPAPSFEIQSLDAAALELAALQSSTKASQLIDPGLQTLKSPAAVQPLNSPSVGAGKADPVSMEDMAIEYMSLDSSVLDSFSSEPALDGSASAAKTPPSAFESLSLESTQDESIQFESIQIEGRAPINDIGSAAGSVAPMQFDDDAFFIEQLSASPVAAEGETDALVRFDTNFDFEGDSGFDVEPVRTAARETETVLSFEELIANSVAAETAQAPPPPNPAAGPPRLPPLPPAASSPSVITDEAAKALFADALSLALVDDAVPSPAAESSKSVGSTVKADISVLEAKISSLSLVDIEDAGSTPAPAGMFGLDTAGVVLIEAGLGGPDPARQLLSAIPAAFTAIVLVRLHLQGGRYDRLVAQMERASALPVALAESGATANPGTIYFIPNGLGVVPHGAKLRFVTEDSGSAAIFASLPANNSAAIFLSGSDPKLVDAAMAAAATGTMIAVQTPEDCYDGIACAELRTRGVTSGLPAELAGRLASRWPS